MLGLKLQQLNYFSPLPGDDEGHYYICHKMSQQCNRNEIFQTRTRAAGYARKYWRDWMHQEIGWDFRHEMTYALTFSLLGSSDLCR